MTCGEAFANKSLLGLAVHICNDCIATQRCQTPEILIASPVISRTTREPSGGRARMMVAIVAVFVHFAIVIIALHSRLAYCIKLLGHRFIIYNSYVLFSYDVLTL